MRTVGVEEEFLLVERDSAWLVAAGEEVVAEARSNSAGQFEQEFKREQAELGSSPQERVADLEQDLRARRRELGAAADAHGARLLACATSPLDDHVSATPSNRYQQMAGRFGRLAQQQLTCGMHVHVSVDSPSEGVAVLDRIGKWLPVLVAMSANSPFLNGRDTDYASYRSVLWGQWPTAGVADPFGSVAGYESAQADLVASGAAMDEGMIYFDARLSSRYPTVEIRVSDVCLDVRDSAVIAALARALVSTAADHAHAGRPIHSVRSELVRAATWRAARWGTEGDLVDPDTAGIVPAWALIDRLVSSLASALRSTGDEYLVQDGVARLQQHGTGAALQRRAFAEAGMTGLVDRLARATLA